MTSAPSIARRWRAAGVLGAFAVLLAFAGCAKSETTQRELTSREHDSILGRTNIPGAFVVTRALKVSDQASARNAGLDAQASSTDDH